jgi:hypothetical protein
VLTIKPGFDRQHSLGQGDWPFDRRLRRLFTHTAKKEQGNKAEEREKLAGRLKEALLPIPKRFAGKVEEDTAPKLLTPEGARAKAKEFLTDDRHRIQLSERGIAQGNEQAQKIVGPEFPKPMSPPLTIDAIKQRVQRYEECSQVALAIMIV